MKRDKMEELRKAAAKEKAKYHKSISVSKNEYLNGLVRDIDVMYPKVALALIEIIQELEK